MAYRLQQSESVSDGLRRIAREQIDKAVTELTDADVDRHEAVHQFRKRGKKIRGLIRLVRPALGDAYQRENRRYRDAARELSRVRDAEAGIWRPVITARVDELKRLADLLGDDHDLALFRTTVVDDPTHFGSQETIERLLGLIQSRRKELQQQSDDLGRRLFAERPKKLVRRFGVYWSVWRTA